MAKSLEPNAGSVVTIPTTQPSSTDLTVVPGSRGMSMARWKPEPSQSPSCVISPGAASTGSTGHCKASAVLGTNDAIDMLSRLRNRLIGDRLLRRHHMKGPVLPKLGAHIVAHLLVESIAMDLAILQINQLNLH